MQVHRSTFDGGLNTNISKALIPANKYVEAQNVNIAGTSNFFSLENIKGSFSLESIIPSTTGNGIAGVFSARFKIGTQENVDGVMIFSYTATTFTVWCYAQTLYKMYEETVTTAYSDSKPIVHAISYPEAGFDIVYFTDNYNELRKIKCEITTADAATPTVAFLTTMDIKLLQHGANGKIELVSIGTNGSLFCGSYQIAYQLVNPANNQFTKFSLFTNPIQIYADSSTTAPKSGVGLQSSSAINITITPSTEELNHYTHFRLAVLENIEPSGVLVNTVQLTKLETIASFLVGATIANVSYTNNTRIESLPLSDIVVDKLAVATAKTLATRDNRLVAGNITYKNLALDNPSGTPIVTGGSILKQTGGATYGNLFADAALSSKYKGYFRDEVYRFAISYFDENGNFSYPSVLDLSAVTHNQITGAYKDMKFPDRSQNLGGTTYTLFSATEGIQSLGLRLTGIDRHPKWARGFVILRAERLKNIIYQTPIIPLDNHTAIGAVEKYPYTALELSGIATKSVTYADAQPMGPFSSFFPRNYFYLRKRSIEENSAVSTGSAASKRFTGEAYYAFNTGFNSTLTFPPTFMYEDKPFTFNPNFKLVTIDAALVKGKYTNFSNLSIGSTTVGKNIKTSVAATFHALNNTQYYFDAAHTGKAVIGGTRNIKDYSQFVNLGAGDVISGKNLFNHDKFETDGINWVDIGSTQKSGVFILDSNITEINSDSLLTFAAGTQIAHSGDTSFYLTDDTFVHTIEIANVKAGLLDTRYGAYNTPHNFISTGTVYTFSDAELTTVRAGTTLPKTVDVWGGDCYVAPHLFKLTDTVYGVTNQGKYDGSGGEATSLDSVKNWGKAFNDDAANECSVSLPVPFKNAASFIEIVLESEYNPGVIDSEIVGVLSTDGFGTVKMPIYGINSTSEGSCRIPLTYKLNQNHKKNNSDKIFQIKDPLLADVTNLSARIIYSDQKVYQTSIIGFDTFRVLNFKDLPELYGDITRLEVLSDDLYALQDRAVSYIGIGERTLETSDALTLAVQSGTFIGNIITVNAFTGCQHTGAVVNSGNAIYFIDNEKQSFNRLAARQVQSISEQDISSSLRSSLAGRRLNTELLALYDPIYKQVWFVHNGLGAATPFCYLFDEARNIWVANYQFAQGALRGGAYSGGFFYIIGVNGANITFERMYDGTRTILLGTTVTPNVKFTVNPQAEVAKVFDDILVPANDRLSTVDFVVSRESLLGDQTASGISLAVTTRGEGNYRAKILRDSANARLRGLYATGNLKWATGAGGVAVAVPSVLTKYRFSDNKF